MSEKLHIIEWHDDKPFDVVTIRDNRTEYYDVDYCKRYDRLYYHNSGSGGDAGESRGLEKLPEGIVTMDDLVGHYSMWEGETVYCKHCNDQIPIDHLCKHIFWDEELCWWNTKEVDV